MKKLFLGVVALFIMAAEGNAQSQVHNEKVEGAGKVYFKIRPAYPLPLERMVFMSQVYNLMDIDSGAVIGEVDKEMGKLMREDPQKFNDLMPKAPDSYKPSPSDMEALAKKVKRFDMNMVKREDVPLVDNIPNPGLMYLTPDNKVYYFDMPPFTAEKQEAEFWKIYGKYKVADNGAGNAFKGKKWSVND